MPSLDFVVLIWFVGLGFYLALREPASSIFPANTTLLRDVTFILSSIFAVAVSTVPLWITRPKLTLNRLLLASLAIAAAVGYLFPFVGFAVYCGIFGRCDP